jgi:XTP/dITP diphosphohydrolase
MANIIILIGTGNKGKQEEYRRIINSLSNEHKSHSHVFFSCYSRANGDLSCHSRSNRESIQIMDPRLREDDRLKNISFLFPQDIDITEEPVETGNTFEENARIKAEFYNEKSGIPSLGDDGGMEIPALNNEPGVTSRRWKGYEMTDEEIINYTLERMKKFKSKVKRTAYLTVTLAFTDGISTIIRKKSVKGYIADEPCKKQTKGYPFRALFIVDNIGKYYEELTSEEHERYNHREKACKAILNLISKM